MLYKLGQKKKNKEENRYYLLYELFQTISSTLDPQKSLNHIIDAAVKITRATSGSLILVDWERKVLDIKVSRGFIEHIGKLQLRLGEGITGWVALTGEPMLVLDVEDEPRYVQIKADIQTELAVPLKLDGKLIGVLNVDSTRKNAFTEEDMDLLQLLANQSAQVIRNGNLFDTVSKKVDELSTLIEINKMIAGTLSLDKILNIVVERTAALMDSKICSIMLLSDGGEELRLRAHYGGSEDYSSRSNIPVNGTLFGRVIREKKSRRVIDIRREIKGSFEGIAEKEGLQSLLSVPLIASGEAIGLLNIYKSNEYRFTDTEKKLLKTFADLSAIAIENARMHESVLFLEEQARRAERIAAVGELAVGIAHEIRNPLTIVKMIFESGSELNEKDKEIISLELTRMNKIITHLLDYARPREPERELCLINKILENTLLLIAYDFEKRTIHIHRKFASGLPRIWADPVQLQQIFLNLLMNAGDAIGDGGEITVSSWVGKKNHVVVQIEDNGPGLPEIVKENLFVPFTTTKRRGLGLGLSIVKRLLDAHNGKMNVLSEVDQGTKIRITLPPN